MGRAAGTTEEFHFSMETKMIRNVLISTNTGQMIVNRFDYCKHFAGVGGKLLESGNMIGDEVRFLMSQITIPNPVIFDVGANIGTLTIPLAQANRQGTIYSFEPQKQVFYMLCGNLALNNLDNVKAYNIGLGKEQGILNIPNIDYYSPASFGSVELTGKQLEDFGQVLDYSTSMDKVQQQTIDGFIQEQEIQNLTILKIDVEGMEFDVLEGAKNTIERFKPIMLVEWWKCDKNKLGNHLESLGYELQLLDNNFVCIPMELK